MMIDMLGQLDELIILSLPNAIVIIIGTASHSLTPKGLLAQLVGHHTSVGKV